MMLDALAALSRVNVKEKRKIRWRNISHSFVVHKPEYRSAS